MEGGIVPVIVDTSEYTFSYVSSANNFVTSTLDALQNSSKFARIKSAI